MRRCVFHQFAKRHWREQKSFKAVFRLNVLLQNLQRAFDIMVQLLRCQRLLNAFGLCEN